MGEAMRSGGVNQAKALGMALLLLFLQWEMVLCTTYVVGDSQGWSPHPELFYWTKGKTFYPGDVLVFNYNNPDYRVAVVDEAGYSNCVAGSNAKMYHSGHDQIPVGPGDNFFIAAVSENCKKGPIAKIYDSGQIQVGPGDNFYIAAVSENCKKGMQLLV